MTARSADDTGVPLRSRRLAAVVVGLALTATAGCGTPPTADAAAEPVVPGLEKAVHQSQGKVPPPTVERLDLRAGEAVEVFGRRRVEQGYAEAVWFASATTFAAQTLLPGPWQNRGAFTRHTSRMTTGMAALTRTTVEDCWQGDTEACGIVYSWRVYVSEDEKRYDPQPEGPFVVDHVISGATVRVDRRADEPRLAVRFEQRGDLRVRMDGEDVLLPLVKEATYLLVPAPEGSNSTWQIDWIEGSTTELDAVPDTGSY
jgi:hypothetical protein